MYGAIYRSGRGRQVQRTVVQDDAVPVQDDGLLSSGHVDGKNRKEIVQTSSFLYFVLLELSTILPVEWERKLSISIAGYIGH